MKGYARWKKLTHMKGGFDLNSKDFDFEKRVQKLFLFYLVYGEINDFRNMKSVLNLFYHNSLERYEQNTPLPKVFHNPQLSIIFSSVIGFASKVKTSTVFWDLYTPTPK